MVDRAAEGRALFVFVDPIHSGAGDASDSGRIILADTTMTKGSRNIGTPPFLI
jgi:hypothetical protein